MEDIISWNDIKIFQKDRFSFIFSLNRKEKYNIKNENKAIFGGNMNGPIFGSNEIYIQDNCKIKGGICSNPKYYNFSSFTQLVGESNFNIIDYEVFSIN